MLYLLYLTTFLHFILGVYLLLKDIKSKVYISFALALFGVSTWSYSNAAFVNSPDENTMIFWTIFAYNVATIMQVALVFFTWFITKRKIKPIPLLIIIITTVIALLLPHIKGLVFTGVNFASKAIIGASLLPVLYLTDFLYIAFIISNLVYGIKTKSGIEKSQIKLISYGIALTMVSGITTNIIFPTLNNYSLVTVGPSFTLLFLSFVVYAIIKHRFLDVRFLLGKIIYYLVLSILPRM